MDSMSIKCVCVASTIIDEERLMTFSTAIDTVLPINRLNQSVSLKRSFVNFVNELEFMTSSLGAISKKYLQDISKQERSTTSTSERV